MLSADNIRTIAAGKSVHPGVVEKDYVLSKVLTGLARAGEGHDSLVFKGGTALKKCFYPAWRYSEDLDFTAGVKSTPAEIQSLFQNTVENVTAAFGVPLRVSEYSQYPKNSEDIVSAQLKLSYDGPLRQSSGQKNNIRVDIALDEVIVVRPVVKSVFTEYGDDLATDVTVYALEEIVAEKLRSILQRGKSRDYYDVWMLLKDFGNDFDPKLTRDILAKKCQFKGIQNPKGDDFFIQTQLAEAERFWERGLAHQVTGLPSFADVVEELRLLIDELIQ